MTTSMSPLTDRSIPLLIRKDTFMYVRRLGRMPVGDLLTHLVARFGVEGALHRYYELVHGKTLDERFGG